MIEFAVRDIAQAEAQRGNEKYNHAERDFFGSFHARTITHRALKLSKKRAA